MSDHPFREIWAVDFEFIQPEGEIPSPVCLVAWELRSRRKIRLWQDQLGKEPPYSLAADSLFVSFAADAELGCHLALGWQLPVRILDLRVEFLRATNTTPPSEDYKDAKLLQALTYYGLDSVNATEKTFWRDLILRGGPWTMEEREGILSYCETDVLAIDRLLPAMMRRSHIHFDPRMIFSLYRGRYMAAVTRMEFVSTPIDMERLTLLRERWEPLKDRLVETMGAEYGVFDDKRSFSERRFGQYLTQRGWGWPLLESGRLDLKDRTFKTMAVVHPELEPLRQLLYTLDKLKLNKLCVGHDGFNRCWLNPFGSRTSRNQPSNTKFIFGPAVWLRDFLIQAKEGWGLAYLDWTGQEFGIAAALSNDPAMREAYESGDIYITFGKQAGVLPEWATDKTHGIERDQFKICVLSTQYGTGYRSLAERIGQPDLVGRELLQHHHKVYHVFWEWSDNRVNRSLLYNRQSTVFGWTHRFEERPKINSVRNFDMQAQGAEMMRLGACLGTERGILACAPVHDAFLLMSPLDRLEEDIAKMRECMEEASRVVLKGFPLRTDVHQYLYPDHYSDPKGRGKKMLATVTSLLGAIN
jgi:DNA polymerase-1